MSEWETFCDGSYYHLWRVRRKSDRDFNDGFHVHDGKEATALVELLSRLERERDEAIAARKNSAADWLGQIEQANTRVSRALRQVAMAERERDEAREAATEQFIAGGRAARERDEAREVAKRLDGAYEDATKYYERIIELIDERDKARAEIARLEQLLSGQ